MVEMSGGMQEEHKVPEAAEYQLAKSRVEKTHTLTTQLKGRMTTREEKYTLAKELVEKHGRSLPVDASEFDSQRIRHIHHNPDNAQETTPEELIFFLNTGEDGEPQMLEQEGKPVFLSAELYDLNCPLPRQWAKNLEQNHRLVPQVDAEGNITNLVQLSEKGDPELFFN